MDSSGSSHKFFTEKQKDFVRMLKGGNLRRINILYGSVRSGKTWISLVVFSMWVATMPDDKIYMMCAKTLTSLKRNCLDLLQELVGENNFSYSIPSKTARLFGRKIYLEGANDSRSESKIRGMTLQGAYIDEVTLIEKGFFAMLLSRLSEPGAKLFGSTNPDSPNHWLKENYIDRASELDMYVDKFVIDDNTFLDAEYVKQIKTEYTGVFYERYILGEFVLAEGLIYPLYEKCLEEPPKGEAEDYCLSLDYGTMNAFAALLWELHGGVWYASRGYYYSGRETGVQKTDEEYGYALDDLVADVMEKRESEGQRSTLSSSRIFEKIKTIIDPSAASFITLLRKKKWYNVIPADNAVLDGIRDTASAMYRGLIKVSPSIKEWRKEAGGYVWDDKAPEDKPIKVDDHMMDSMRYFVRTKRIAVHQTKYKSFMR